MAPIPYDQRTDKAGGQGLRRYNETAAKIVIVLAVVAIAAIVIRFLVTGSLTI